MKKTSILLWAVFVITVALAPAEAKTFLSIATGGAAGVYYPMGVGLAKVITRYAPDVEVTAETTNASVANINMIAGHDVALALVQNDVAFRAVKGDKPFKEPVKNLKMIASLYPEHVHCITARGSGVKTFNDLRGKRVSLGAPGSGVTDSLSVIMSVANLKYADVNADFLDFANTVDRIQEGALDAGFVLAGYPAAAVVSLAAQNDIDLVAFDDDLLNKLSAEYTYFAKDVIPAGTYEGVDHDTLTPAVMAVLVCDADMADNLVYDITKAIFENLSELTPIHAKAASIALDKALEAAAIEVHPGAAKYYTEKGIKVPTF